MRISVLGLGYIGLPTAAMLACGGHDVFGTDARVERISEIVSGEAYSSEADVTQAVGAALASRRLRVGPCLEPADAYIICVPTPTKHGRPDLRYVEQASRSTAALAKSGDLIILESTVPPGTTENMVARSIAAFDKDPDAMHIVHCPERVIPGDILRELRDNSRVIGGRMRGDAELARDLYRSFCSAEMFLTDALTAEIVKIVENTYRDVNLAFANELARLSEELGVDAWEVIRLANKHPRVNVLRPGPGVGGHCIPVDPQFLSNANPFVTELIQAARRVNERMPHVVARLIDEMLPSFRSHRRKIALLGASYKADVDDTRESPTYAVAELLDERQYELSIYDPIAKGFGRPLRNNFESAVCDADALVLLTDHSVFRELDPYVAARAMKELILIDTRHFLDRDLWRRAGFRVRILGDGSPYQSVSLAST